MFKTENNVMILIIVQGIGIKTNLIPDILTYQAMYI